MFKNCCGCQNSDKKKNKTDDEEDSSKNIITKDVTIEKELKVPPIVVAPEKSENLSNAVPGKEVKVANAISPGKVVKAVPSPAKVEKAANDVPSTKAVKISNIETASGKDKKVPSLILPEENVPPQVLESPSVLITEPAEPKADQKQTEAAESLKSPISSQPKSEFISGLPLESNTKDNRIEIPDDLAQDLLSSGAILSGCEIIPRGASCTPHPSKRGASLSALPKWLSQDEDEVFELGGTQEPPATPVGRDELAMRRHRFFSDIMLAQQAGTEHRVRFDPLGPTVAGEIEPSASAKQLENLIQRLEQVTVRLEERVVSPSVSSLSPSPLTRFEIVSDNMSVAGFNEILSGPFGQYLKLSRTIGGDVASHSALVEAAFKAQLQYLTTASTSRAPASQAETMKLLQPTSTQIQAIQEFREKQRGSPHFNHLSAISESIPALGWVAVTPTPGPYVKEMNDAGQFYTNRVLKDFKEKDKNHVEWVKSWVQTLSQLQAFIKQHHTTGLVWGGKGMGGPPPPPGLPPPPPMLPMGEVTPLVDDGKDRSALFAEINRGEGITSSLKKVTADMQTHKNSALREGPAPFKAPGASAVNSRTNQQGAIDKPPSFVREGKKWLVEYQKGNHNLVIDAAEMNNMVYMFKCTDSTLTIKGKLNAVFLDSCKKTSVVFDSLVASVEFVNCQSVQMQVLQKIPTISIDKTDGCQMYLSAESLDVEIVSSKSSEMNVMVPKANGDYVEYAVPEQFKTKIGKNGLTTICVDSLG